MRRSCPIPAWSPPCSRPLPERLPAPSATSFHPHDFTKTLSYFTHQLLREQDFKDEHAYHIEMRRRHNRLFHSWGVVEGLEVKERGPQEIVVDAGVAIDNEGWEIILPESQERDLSSLSHDSEVEISLHYHEEESERVSGGGVEGHTRLLEEAVVHESRHGQGDPSGVPLARVHLGDHGHIQRIDISSAFRKGARPNIGAGWVCMPFKPVRLNPIRISGQLVRSSSDEYDFIVDEATAYSDTNGARGSMEIPVPPGATGVSGFRTDAQVIMRLFRVGWNRRENKGDNCQLLEETIEQGTFHKEMAVHSELDESHALAVSVRAHGKSEIWPVAVRFD